MIDSVSVVKKILRVADRLDRRGKSLSVLAVSWGERPEGLLKRHISQNPQPIMDNLRNLFGQVSTLTSSKTTGTMGAGSSASGGADPGANGGMMNPGERQRSISGDFSGLGTHQNRTMKQFKTADRDSYYYIMWRS